MASERQPNLQLVERTGQENSVHRGRLMTAHEVSREIFGSYRPPEWVRRNVPGKISFGHSTVMWYQKDVIEWIKSLREGAVR